MRKMLALMTFASAAMLTVSPVAAGAIKVTPSAAVTTDIHKVAAGVDKRVRHVRSARRHRAARVHRNRWRNILIYTAHDRHGYRHYEYVLRKLHGYFASTRGTRAFPRLRDYRDDSRWHI